ncbi:hypothetical protein D9M71_248190 [compost metagenome]
MQRRLHLLVEITVHAVNHHIHRAPTDLRDQLGIMGADSHQFGGLAQHTVLPAPVAPAVEGVERAQPQRQAIVAGAAHYRLQGVLTKHVGQPASLQGFFERLEAVTVLNLDHVPGFVQQLLEPVPQARRQAIDDSPHGVVDDG